MPLAASSVDVVQGLFYDKPAGRWTEALPVGNGHLGAMVFGRVEHERMQLNEHSLWSGRPANEDREQTRAALPRVRQLLFEGKYAEANRLAQAEMMAPLDNASVRFLPDARPISCWISTSIRTRHRTTGERSTSKLRK